MISIQCESLEDMIEELKSFLLAHHQEVEDGAWQPDPDYDHYLECSKLGLMICTTIRDCGKLIGYSIDWQLKSLHYKGKTAMINDLIYILPEYRHMGLMKKLFEYLHVKCKSSKISMHSINLKVTNPCKQLMTELGYTNQEIVWMRRF